MLTHRELRVASTDGTLLHTEVFGQPDRPAVVLVHGYLSGSAAWHYQVADLADDHRVIVYDQRGHGRSPMRRLGSYSLDALADDLDAVLAATLSPAERAVVVGHSLGGVSIIAWAERRPGSFAERAGGIALLNTTAAEPITFLPPSVIVRIAARLTSGMPIGARAGRHIRPRLISALTARCVAPEVGELIYQTFMTTPRRGRSGWTRMLLTDLTATSPAVLTAPTLVVDSKYDRLLGPEHGSAVARAAPDLFRHVSLDCGHYSILERPMDISAHLRDLTLAVL
jgi:pimeloyl-ACP methyl ester carboxylesterase